MNLDKCHFIQVERVGLVLIPECIGTAARGMDYCTCKEYKDWQYEKKQMTEEIQRLKERLENCGKENWKLQEKIIDLENEKK